MQLAHLDNLRSVIYSTHGINKNEALLLVYQIFLETITTTKVVRNIHTLKDIL